MRGRARYELVLARKPSRVLAEELPESVATAVIEFLTSTLVQNPRRAGKPLRNELAGLWAARRGTYRVIYEIDQRRREVNVLRIEHRRDAYRPF